MLRIIRRPHFPPSFPPSLRLLASRLDKKSPREEEEDYLEAGFEDDIDIEDMRAHDHFDDLHVGDGGLA